MTTVSPDSISMRAGSAASKYPQWMVCVEGSSLCCVMRPPLALQPRELRALHEADIAARREGARLFRHLARRDVDALRGLALAIGGIQLAQRLDAGARRLPAPA